MGERLQGNGLRAAVSWPCAVVGALLLVLFTLGGNSVVFATEDLSVFSPASQPAASVRDLFYLVLGITGAIFLLVEGMLIYATVRYRRRQAAIEPEPAQVYGSQPLEVAWTVAPSLIVFVLFLVVVRSVVEAQQGNDDPPALRVQLIGHQWWWDIVYPGEAPESPIHTANEIHVPTGADGRSARGSKSSSCRPT